MDGRRNGEGREDGNLKEGEEGTDSGWKEKWEIEELGGSEDGEQGRDRWMG